MLRGSRRSRARLALALALAVVTAGAIPGGAGRAEAAPGEETVVFAGGCFWGVQAVFQRVRGVTKAVSGYAGGSAGTARYELVSRGTTGHAESVEVTWDPARVSYAQLLQVFFTVAHDPTELDRQGPDVGTQYRSAIFFMTPAQKTGAQAYMDQLAAAKKFPRAIVTQVVPLAGFYRAEDYHQDYFNRHPDEPYIVFNDWPKVDSLRKAFPSLYVERYPGARSRPAAVGLSGAG
jgi:peptide-methionine (S)-S-oxide reductase